jgi:hypothetical protein
VGLSRKEKGNFGVSPKLKASSILMLQIVLWVVYYKCLWYEVLFVGRIRRVFFESTHTTQHKTMKWKCFEREHTRKIKKGMGFYLKDFGVCGGRRSKDWPTNTGWQRHVNLFNMSI